LTRFLDDERESVTPDLMAGDAGCCDGDFADVFVFVLVIVVVVVLVDGAAAEDDAAAAGAEAPEAAF